MNILALIGTAMSVASLLLIESHPILAIVLYLVPTLATWAFIINTFGDLVKDFR